jgi:hypothetical protein
MRWKVHVQIAETRAAAGFCCSKLCGACTKVVAMDGGCPRAYASDLRQRASAPPMSSGESSCRK